MSAARRKPVTDRLLNELDRVTKLPDDALGRMDALQTLVTHLAERDRSFLPGSIEWELYSMLASSVASSQLLVAQRDKLLEACNSLIKIANQLKDSSNG